MCHYVECHYAECHGSPVENEEKNCVMIQTKMKMKCLRAFQANRLNPEMFNSGCFEGSNE
jgi:hypothetical protein